MNELIDTHCHLDEFSIKEITNFLQKNLKIISVSMGLKSCMKNLKLSKLFPNKIYPCFGIHPWSINEEKFESVKNFILTNLKSTIAIGEVGLDGKIKTPLKSQLDVFIKFVELAQSLHLPIIIHCLVHFDVCFKILKDKNVEKAVFHWYSGDLNNLKKILFAGYFISATPAIAYSKKHIKAIKFAPIEQILIESDAPVKYKGKESTPLFTFQTLELLSKLKNIEKEKLKILINQNAKEFFNL